MSDSPVGTSRNRQCPAPPCVDAYVPVCLPLAVVLPGRLDGAVTFRADPRVDAYIGGLPAWQASLCRDLRGLVHAADDDVVETIKRTDRPYFVLNGNICALLATKDHVNLFLYDGAIVPDPARLITGGHDNSTARTIAFREGDVINREALLVMLRQIIANNRAGGWRKLKNGLSPTT